MTTLERSDAELLVKNVTTRIGIYAAVKMEDARDLLGADDFMRMCKDPIRNLGPNTETFYPWNVVDYLSGYGLKASEVRR